MALNKYICFKTALTFIFNIPLLVIAIILFESNLKEQIDVITAETDLWDQPAIVDLFFTDSACPAGYEQAESLFYGTNNYCRS